MEWLWLEDAFDVIEDIVNTVINAEFKIKKFETPAALTKELIKRKEEKDTNFGLILDLLLFGQKYIMLHPDLYSPKLEKGFSIKTECNGHDAGLLLYEKFFIDDVIADGKKFVPALAPPPVIFLTVSEIDALNYRERFDHIKEVWTNKNVEVCNSTMVDWVEKNKVEWIVKFNNIKKEMAELKGKWKL